MSDMEDKKRDNTIWTVVVLFLLLLFFFAIIIIAGRFAGSGDIIAATGTAETGFLTSCALQDCTDNYVCDGVSFTCKLGTGALCRNFSECIDELICSGRCVSPNEVGGLNQYCPCNDGYQCILQLNGYRVCKGVSNSPCNNNSDCASNYCKNNVCSDGKANSYPCNSNNECQSNNCSKGYCQSKGITTGDKGSACSGACLAIVGAACDSSFVCQCSEDNTPGTCVKSNLGIYSSCSINNVCAPSLVCYNEDTQYCSADESCQCLFPEFPPASVSCIDGMTKIGNSCYNNSSIGCSSDSQCSNICNGGSVLNRYIFTNNNNVNQGTVFLGATNTKLTSISGPTGLLSPYKMFATSEINSGTDTIYLIDHLQGLLTIDVKPFINSITPWRNLIPYNTSNRILIDVAIYQNTTLLVAFNETTTEGTNDTLYLMNNGQLSYFNYVPGSGITGTQYSNGNPLTIDYISVSKANDTSNGGDVIITSNGTVYLRPFNSTNYNIATITGGDDNGTQMVGVTGPTQFYYDNIEHPNGATPPVCPNNQINQIQCSSSQNIAYITNGNLQFSGSLAGVTFPSDQVIMDITNFNIYDVTKNIIGGTGMRYSPMIFLGSDQVSIAYQGNNIFTPFNIDSSVSVAAVSAFSYYIMSIASCS